MELWKDVKGYEGFYQVSNEGKVRCLKYWNHITKDWSSVNRYVKPTDNGNGYKIVGLSVHGIRKNHYVHRMVAEAFLVHPYGKDYVNHIDHNRGNNNVENLEWCTQKENVLHSVPRMKAFKNHKENKSGERYIIARGEKFRVIIKQKEYGLFKDLKEAIKRRDYILQTMFNYSIYGEENEKS